MANGSRRRFAHLSEASELLPVKNCQIIGAAEERPPNSYYNEASR